MKLRITILSDTETIAISNGRKISTTGRCIKQDMLSNFWLLTPIACYDKTSNVRHWCMTPRHWGWKEAHEVDSMCIISILAQGNAKFKIKILHYPYILSGLWRSNVKNFMSYFQNVARYCPHPDGEPTILHVPQLASRVRRGHPYIPSFLIHKLLCTTPSFQIST